MSFFTILEMKKKIPVNEISNSIAGGHKLMEVSKAKTSLKLTLPTLNKSVHEFLHNDRLFEEFFIISAPLSAIDSMSIPGYLPSSILFQYPNLPENSDWYYF